MSDNAIIVAEVALGIVAVAVIAVLIVTFIRVRGRLFRSR